VRPQGARDGDPDPAAMESERVRRAGRLAAPRPAFVGTFRATMMLTTWVCILAVDFQVFPRRFAKAESDGVGVMDLGVGSFVLSSGLVSHRVGGGRQAGGMRAALAGAVPLLVLWLGRLLSVKAADYQEHVSEYGVHWNFFATQALVSLAAAALPPLACPATLAAALVLGHQAALDFGGLQTYILTAPRDGWITANKEGLFSVPGYLAFYLFGAQAGRWLLSPITLPPANDPANASTAGWAQRARVLAALSGLAWLLLLVVCDVLPAQGGIVGGGGVAASISRRLLNMPYVLWLLAQNGLLLTGFMVAELVAPAPAALCVLSDRRLDLLEAINANQLALFLLANLATGAVNLSMRTLDASDTTALVVLVSYLLALSTVAITLGTHGVRLKL
jgi:phosphatidylinositol glycan class W